MAADADRMPPTKPSRNPATFFFRQLLGLWQRSGSRFDSRRLSLSSPKLVFRFCLFLRLHWSCFKSFTERKLFNLLASTEIGARQVSQRRLKQRWQKRDYVFLVTQFSFRIIKGEIWLSWNGLRLELTGLRHESLTMYWIRELFKTNWSWYWQRYTKLLKRSARFDRLSWPRAQNKLHRHSLATRCLKEQQGSQKWAQDSFLILKKPRS